MSKRLKRASMRASSFPGGVLKSPPTMTGESLGAEPNTAATWSKRWSSGRSCVSRWILYAVREMPFATVVAWAAILSCIVRAKMGEDDLARVVNFSPGKDGVSDVAVKTRMNARRVVHVVVSQGFRHGGGAFFAHLLKKDHICRAETLMPAEFLYGFLGLGSVAQIEGDRREQAICGLGLGSKAASEYRTLEFRVVEAETSAQPAGDCCSHAERRQQAHRYPRRCLKVVAHALKSLRLQSIRALAL